MIDAYVGMISRRGLECFVPETEHAALFLLRRAMRSSSTLAVCCWAVLRREDAARIQQLLRNGNSADGLTMLHNTARSLGTLLPPPEDHDLI